jgi:hypothetical protein
LLFSRPTPERVEREEAMSGKMLKVISAVEGKDGKTSHWNRIGTAFINRDESINVYLECFPRSGTLQIRELDERDKRPSRSTEPSERDLTAAVQASLAVATTSPAASQDIPF